MRLGKTLQDWILLNSPAKTHVLICQFIHHRAMRVTGIESNVEATRHLPGLLNHMMHEAFHPLGRMYIAGSQNGVNETIAQSHAVARAVVVPADREAGDQRMVDRFFVVVVVESSRLAAMHCDRETVNVDGRSHDSVVAVATGAAQVTVRPVEQTTPQRFLILFEIRQPIDQPRLSRLTGESLFDDFFSTSIPSRHPHRGIVCQSIEIILMLTPHRHCIESFAKEFRGGVANAIWTTRIEEFAR